MPSADRKSPSQRDGQNSSTQWYAVVLAAGKGTRMKSKKPKVLHEVSGRPMLGYVVEAAKAVGVREVVVVVGQGAKEVKRFLGESATPVEQREQLGTGHALLQAKALLGGFRGNVLVLNGDVPLVKTKTLNAMMEHHIAHRAVATVLTCQGCSMDGLGRVVRDGLGKVTGIVEEAEMLEEHKAITEVNAGIYCFEAEWLLSSLEGLRPGKKGELYLTDLIAMALEAGRPAEGYVTKDQADALGINDRIQLAMAEGLMRERIRENWMRNGVTFVDPPSTFVDADVRIGQDTVIYPFTTIVGRTTIGEECEIGPHAIIKESVVGDRCKVEGALLEGASLAAEVQVGPFCHLRSGSRLETGVHLGNFVEVKKSHLAKGAKAGHFSYIGDAIVGENVNIGAGTVTCNYDGVRKNQTIIEDDAFIGSDCMLVAPVRVGARARTGAGSVVTKDVPPDATVVGVPARKVPAKPQATKPEP